MKKLLRDSLLREYGCLNDNDGSSATSTSLKHAVINMRMTHKDGIPSIINGK
jgi:hypothetical protein